MENKTIIISGANGNVGSYFSQKFCEDNNLLLLAHKSLDRIQHLDKKDSVEILTADITDFKQLKIDIKEILRKKNWQPTVFIHTASIRSSDFSPLVDSPIEQWRKVMEVNVLGTYHLLKILIPYFSKSNYGRILLFGSNVSRIGLKNGSAYAASKAAVANLTRTLSQEFGEKNILINTLSPGPIDIDNRNFSANYRKFREEYYEKEKSQIPLNRIAKLSDIYEISNHLISKENTYLTGEEIFLTGGKL